MIKTISKAALALALAMGGSATMLGGTALASTGAAPTVHTVPAAGIHTVPAACTYTFYWNGFPITFPCPAKQSNGGTATNNCNANCSASAKGKNGN